MSASKGSGSRKASTAYCHFLKKLENKQSCAKDMLYIPTLNPFHHRIPRAATQAKENRTCVSCVSVSIANQAKTALCYAVCDEIKEATGQGQGTHWAARTTSSKHMFNGQANC